MTRSTTSNRAIPDATLDSLCALIDPHTTPRDTDRTLQHVLIESITRAISERADRDIAASYIEAAVALADRPTEPASSPRVIPSSPIDRASRYVSYAYASLDAAPVILTLHLLRYLTGEPNQRRTILRRRFARTVPRLLERRLGNRRTRRRKLGYVAAVVGLLDAMRCWLDRYSASDAECAAHVMLAATSNRYGRALVEANRHDGTEWFNRERYGDLVSWLAIEAALDARVRGSWEADGPRIVRIVELWIDARNRSDYSLEGLLNVLEA